MSTPVQEWYTGRSILVTGGTGFMGKVLLEKLLRSLPGLNKVYVLLRPKRGQSPEKRIEEILKLPLFERLHAVNKEMTKKLIAIEANFSDENLGISERNKKLLIEEVSVVFHMAATLRLEANVKESVELNTLGTVRIFELCEQFKKLESFVHLSTAFCHCDVDRLEEKIYKPTADPYETIKLVQSKTTQEMLEIQDSLMKPHPNSYIFSKRLAEVVANDMGKKLPVSIARPSIVIPTLNEPMPGWVDSLNGPVGVLVAAGKGVLRTMMCETENHAEVIPVDVAINGLIVIAWSKATKRIEETPVYNLTTSDMIKVSWGEILNKGKEIIYKYPFEWTIWYPGGDIRTNRLIHNLIIIFFHYIPAYFIDFLLFIFMQRRFMVRVQNRISLGMHLLEYFTLREWDFANKNSYALEDLLTDEDVQIFTMKSCKYDIDDYLLKAVVGTRVYCVKENMSSLTFCRIYVRFLYYLDKFTKMAVCYGLLWFILKLFGASHLLTWAFWSKEDVHFRTFAR